MLGGSDFSVENHFTEIYKQYKNAHIAIREAMCLQAQFPAILTDILEQDLIAGRLNWGLVGFSPHNGPPLAGYGYYCFDEKIIDALEKGNVPVTQRDAVMDMLHYWKKEASQRKVEAAFTERMIPALYRDEINTLPFNYKPMVGIPIYRMAGIFVDYQKLLRLGVSGLLEEVLAYRDSAKQNGGDFQLYEGLAISLEVLAECCRHYQRQAAQKAAGEAGAVRKSQLLKLAQVLNKISCEKPETFYEAMQLSWLYTQLCGTLELGRMDVYLGDFYVRDLETGKLNEVEALALMCSLWKLINDQFREVDGRVIIGGKGRPNEANADRFALLALETTRSYGKAILPQLTLRFYEGMNPALMKAAIALIGDGYTYPLLYNDDVLIESVQHALDVPLAEAEQYVPLGCGEIVLDHRGYGTPSGALNVLKALEVTLHNGIDPITGQRMGLATGELKDFESFAEMMSAYKQQLTNIIEILAEHEELEYRISGQEAPFLYLTLLYDDCLPRGKSIFAGGIRYLGGTVEAYGNVNAADSLTAIKELVYEKKLLSAERLLEALENNFVGYEDERKLMLTCPKYGNDDPAADGMMVELHNFLGNTIRDQKDRTQLDWYLEVLINNSQNTTLGRWVGASADGRKAGLAMANANTPAGGNDKKGITALINSIVKPDTGIHAGSVQNMRFGRDLILHQPEKFKAILDTYFRKGGSQAMITVINRGDLEKAMLEPEQYKDLFVRVGGFSARFVDLPKDVQREILSRNTY
jgi:pyruvate-formate lyase